MKKYTIIYNEYVTLGNYITKKKYIECLSKDLQHIVEEDIGWSNVWFCLDGHAMDSLD